MVEECPPEIPFFGGGAVPENTTPFETAGWVAVDDKIPLLLALSLYTQPHQEFFGWTLIKDELYRSPRYAAWFNQLNGQCIVGLRGTQATGKGGREDVKDDTVSYIVWR